MAENKKSFLLYCDLIHTIEKMPDDKAGQLLKHILRYVNDLNPITDDLITQLTFEPIRQSLKRDLLKWAEKSPKRIEKARIAGLASAEARRLKKELNSTNELQVQLNPTKPTVSVSVSVSDNVKVKENNIDNRKLKFASTLEPFKNIYHRDMLIKFFKYWTQPNKSNTKFKQELEKTWSLSLRLENWSNNNYDKGKTIVEPIGKKKIALNDIAETPII
jgi:hypothetical protein